MSACSHLDPRRIDAFRRMIYSYYRLHGRRLPWRGTADPYGVLISEVMLQQTQVPRVLLKYDDFMARFPDIISLTHASLHEILGVWQGLGYNRRALALKRAAEHIVTCHDGLVPDDEESLVKLPGIGTATARAIQAFAFNKPVVFIETNIRAVFLHYFFKGMKKVSDRELEPIVEETLDRKNPGRWYSGLMDYGTCLKKAHGNPARASAHHTGQSPFEGSKRQTGGAILRILLTEGTLPEETLAARLNVGKKRVHEALAYLERDNLISREGPAVSISRK